MALKKESPENKTMWLSRGFYVVSETDWALSDKGPDRIVVVMGLT